MSLYLGSDLLGAVELCLVVHGDIAALFGEGFADGRSEAAAWGGNG